MMTTAKIKGLSVGLLMLVAAVGLRAGGKNTTSVPETPTASEARDAEYARKLDERATKIVDALELKNPDKAVRVHGLIVAQYRTLNTWHETYDARLKELGKVAVGTDAEKADAAKKEIETIKVTLKAAHDNYLAQLASELTPEQIDRVKDGMTVGKVQFTFTGYVQQYPTLTEEQKARILEFLKMAREEAIDAGSMDEKAAIFGRYKGKINNYLSKEGVEQQGKAGKVRSEKKDAESK